MRGFGRHCWSQQLQFPNAVAICEILTAGIVGEDEEERRPQTNVSSSRVRFEDGLYSQQKKDCKERVVSGSVGATLA